jgi:hypothetical protein
MIATTAKHIAKAANAVFRDSTNVLGCDSGMILFSTCSASQLHVANLYIG